MSNEIIWSGPDDELVEQPESPAWNLGEKITCALTYKGIYALCLSSSVPKGTLGTGELAGYQVANSQVTKERGNIGTLKINWEAVGIVEGQSVIPSLPPDEYGIEAFELNPDIRRHPFFASLSDNDMRAIDDFANGKDPSIIPSTTTGVPDLERYEADLSTYGKAALAKLRRGVSNYYLAAFRYHWTTTIWTLSESLDKGGVIETPGGPLADSLPSGMSWLRQADSLAYSSQYLRLTRSWLGGPSGHWDTDLYAS